MQNGGRGDGRSLDIGGEARTASGDRRFRPDIEGLRAVAVLLVLFFHFYIPGFGAGLVGVDVFFVISGFVITRMLVREHGERGIQVRGFFARRCRRIIPVAAVVLVVSVFLERVLSGRAAARTLVTPAHSILLFVFNWNTDSVARLLVTNNPIMNYWTLSVEEQFYVVYPFLLAAVGLVVVGTMWRSRAALVIATATLASFVWTLVGSSQGEFSVAGYVSTLTRAWQLGLGCLLAFATPWLLRLPKRAGFLLAWGGLTMVVVSACTLSIGTSAYPNWTALFPTIGAALVIAGGTPVPDWGPEGLLRLRAVRRLGQWSYGAYLWQIPVLLLVVHWWGAPNTVPVAARLAFIGAAIALAGLSFHVLETPVRNNRYLSESPARTFVLAAAITACGWALVSLLGT